MRIEDHRLVGVDFKQAADIGPRVTPHFVMIHYTAGKNSLNWLTQNDETYVSAHVLIGRDGHVTQLVPFNKAAYHAGRGKYKDYEDLNYCSVGIELENFGVLTDDNVTWTGETIPAEQVIVAEGKYQRMVKHWQTYTDVQLDACSQVVTALRKHYPIKEVIGHDDYAPTRKLDPGPAFPISIMNVELKNINAKSKIKELINEVLDLVEGIQDEES